MSTSHSPLRKLRAEAGKIAARLKSLERGDDVGVSDPAGRVDAARQRDAITFGVVMDDKVIKIEMPWTQIRETSEAGISEFILQQMRGAREAVN